MAEYACEVCVHWAGGQRCLAFGPKTIPADILDGTNWHTQEVPGDNGIRFERREPPEPEDESQYIGRRAQEWLDDPKQERFKTDHDKIPDAGRLNRTADG